MSSYVYSTLAQQQQYLALASAWGITSHLTFSAAFLTAGGDSTLLSQAERDARETKLDVIKPLYDANPGLLLWLEMACWAFRT